MAPKQSYTRERLDGIVHDSVANMNTLLNIGELTCEYLHRGTDEFVKGSDMLNFIWKIEAAGYCDTYETTVRCNHAVERGVPFPDRWKTILNCLTLRDVVRESTKDVTEFGASNVSQPASSQQPAAIRWGPAAGGEALQIRRPPLGGAKACFKFPSGTFMQEVQVVKGLRGVTPWRRPLVQLTPFFHQKIRS